MPLSIPRQRPRGQFAIVGISLLVGILAGVALRLHYSIVFLPRFYGSFTESILRLQSWEAWWAYLQSPVGLVLHFLLLASFTVTILAFIAPRLGHQ